MIPESFSMLSQILNSDEMTQHISEGQSINALEVLADFADRSEDAVIAVLNSINFTSLKRISFKSQKSHRSALLRLWTSVAAFDYHVHEDYMQNLFIFLISFLASDADPVPTQDDLCRVLYLLVIACHENDLAIVKCKENGIPLLVKNYLKSPCWKLRCLCCILLSQLCYERNDLKEYIFYDAAMSDLLLLLSDPHPEVRAASLVFLQSFIGFSSNDPIFATANVHVYLRQEDIEALVNSKDPSIKRDQTILESITRHISMKSECSVMVRRELFRFILKVFSRRCHMAHLICFVDRILKNELDVATILDRLSSSNGDYDTHDANLFYVKYWIIILSLRDAEPNVSIRKAASHYVNVICKNVDNLKNKGPLPLTPSIFDFSSLLQLNPKSPSASLQRQSSLASLPTLPSPRSTQDAPPTDISSLPLLSTSHVSSHPLSPTSVLPPNVATTLVTTARGGDSPFQFDARAASTVHPQQRHSGSFQRQSSHALCNSLVTPPLIAATPSFSNLQLTTQPVNTSERMTHLDAWLEVQLGLLGLPSTYVEWFINSFVVKKEDEEQSCKEIDNLRFNARSFACSYNETAKDFEQRRRVLHKREVKCVTQRDVFHTNGSKIASISFHPYFSTIAVVP